MLNKTKNHTLEFTLLGEHQTNELAIASALTMILINETAQTYKQYTPLQLKAFIHDQKNSILGFYFSKADQQQLIGLSLITMDRRGRKKIKALYLDHTHSAPDISQAILNILTAYISPLHFFKPPNTKNNFRIIYRVCKK